jgi:hypothetical protein
MQAPIPEIVHEAISVVVLGTFVPAKFSSYWVVERCGLAKELEEAAELFVIKTHDASRLKIGRFTINCDSERLVLAVDSVASEPELYDLVMAVLRTGEFSELTAIGINSEVICKLYDESLWHKIGHTLVPKEKVWEKLTENPGMNNVEILSPKHTELGELLESTSVKPHFGTKYKPGIIASCNLHYSIPPETRQHPCPAWESAAKFIQAEWPYMNRRARTITDTILSEIK